MHERPSNNHPGPGILGLIAAGEANANGCHGVAFITDS
jgi:hypothetical protein